MRTPITAPRHNPYWLSDTPPDQGNVDGGFANSYQIAFDNLIGTVPSRNDVFNYRLDSATSGTLLPDGAAIDRHFKSNEYEGYLQDSWRVRPNLTITYGLRYSLLQTPWETHGQQVTPTIDTHAWYQQREIAAQSGQIYEPDLTFAPAGHFYNKPGYWPQPKGNFAPRLSIAYSPDTKTSIRVGAGIYYDHFGQSLVSTFDQNGSYGMSSAVNNPASVYAVEGDCADPSQCNNPGAPRFISRSSLPPIQTTSGPAPATATFPYTAPLDNFAITWGIDNKLQTPYSESFDLSVQRELPGGFTLETSYVGRLGRHLLQQLDLAEPVDYVDPQGGGDYFAAGTQLSKVVDQNQGCGPYSGPSGCTPPNVQAIPYFEHVFPFMANYDYDGESATQAIYDNEWSYYRYTYGATSSLADIDFSPFGVYDFPSDWQLAFLARSVFIALFTRQHWHELLQRWSGHSASPDEPWPVHGLQLHLWAVDRYGVGRGTRATFRALQKRFLIHPQHVESQPQPRSVGLRYTPSDYRRFLYLLPFGVESTTGRQFKRPCGPASLVAGNCWQCHWSSGLPFSLLNPAGLRTGKLRAMAL